MPTCKNGSCFHLECERNTCKHVSCYDKSAFCNYDCKHFLEKLHKKHPTRLACCVEFIEEKSDMLKCVRLLPKKDITIYELLAILRTKCSTLKSTQGLFPMSIHGDILPTSALVQQLPIKTDNGLYVIRLQRENAFGMIRRPILFRTLSYFNENDIDIRYHFRNPIQKQPFLQLFFSDKVPPYVYNRLKKKQILKLLHARLYFRKLHNLMYLKKYT